MPRQRPRRAVLLIVAAVLATACPPGQLDLGPAEHVADGVELYRLEDPSLLEPPAPVLVHLLRLDPGSVDLRGALSNDEVMGTETVVGIATRRGALAAINAGLFAPNGDPTGILQLGGELVSDAPRARGALAVIEPMPGRPVELMFDRVSVSVSVEFSLDGQSHTVPIAGVDTTRARGRLMLFTPSYHPDTDTARGGIEWILDGRPLKVTGRSVGIGRAPIPRQGAVLSFGGTEAPPPLDRLHEATEVRIVPSFRTLMGTPSSAWEAARDIVGGAGLLVVDGRPVQDWSPEALRTGFDIERHPRTVVGVGELGEIWLIVVDGRSPQLSAGMSFRELQRLAARLHLRHALNLDGGGSTAMVVRGAVVNHPSDATGPRPVSDALLVLPR
jgi:hypothetical protein